MKTNPINLSTNLVHDGLQLNEGETNNVNIIGDQPVKFSINRKSWAKWKSVSDKLKERLG